MRSKVRNYFDSFGLQTKRMVDRNRFKLDRKKIECGMKLVYARIERGEKIKPHRLMANVCKEALAADKKTIADYESQYEEKRITELSNRVTTYHELLVIETAILIFAVAGLFKLTGVF